MLVLRTIHSSLADGKHKDGNMNTGKEPTTNEDDV
jgi:hypothetical protein